MIRTTKNNPYRSPRSDAPADCHVDKKRTLVGVIACVVCSFFAVASIVSGAVPLILLFSSRMGGGEAEWLSLALSGGFVFVGILYICAAQAW